MHRGTRYGAGSGVEAGLRFAGPLAVAALIAVIAGIPAAVAAPVAPDRQPVGCVAKGASFREHGWRGSRKVALTFDGGPTSQYTSRVLNRLAKAGVHSTFFIRGAFIKGHTALLRRELREGHELANHSWTHPHFPNAYELSRTTRAIRGATGFTPCLFRAPYGSVNGDLFARARRQGMLTIGWDADSWDSLYDNISTSTVYNRVVSNVRPGSIILMHDGEGSHEATIQALGPILRALKRKRLQPVTVSELLGLRTRYACGSHGVCRPATYRRHRGNGA